jgi:hypothetical protein
VDSFREQDRFMISTPERRTTAAVRRSLTAAAVLVLGIGTVLYVLSGATDRFFAWTIKVPLTAAFLGAAYLASGLVEIAAARSRIWVHARLAGPPVLIFTGLTLWVTLAHRAAFHFGPGHPLTARFVAWTWLAVYAAFPVALVVALIAQVRTPGTDPPRRGRLSRWVTVVLGVHTAVFLVAGLALLLAPAQAARLWPWPLTPLTARALGAWGVGLGVGTAQAIWEGDWLRLRAATPFYLAFGLLGLVAVLRYADTVAWRRPSAWILVTLLASLLVGGWYALRSAASVRAA